MKKYYMLISLLIIVSTMTSCSSSKDNDSNINIAVSILPEVAFVEAVLGDKGTVTTVIPPGFSPANYQPSPKELLKISDADLYFSIGVLAETNILPKIVTDKTKLISLSDEVNKKYPLLRMDANHPHHDQDSHVNDDNHEHDEDSHDTHDNHKHDEDSHINHDNHKHDGLDPHIWMSPKRVKVIIETIKDSLIEQDPNNSKYYSSNAEKYIQELTKLDNYITNSLKSNEIKSFIIYHPSLGYLADDYGLNMLSIEQEGKKATIDTIKSVVDFANDNNINVIFYQEEFDSKQAKVIADEIEGNVVSLDILSKDYINNMKKIIDALTDDGTK